MRPGWKTTEFWGRAVVTLAGLGAASGLLRPETARLLEEAAGTALPIVRTVIDGVIELTGLIGALVLQYRHGRERAALKAEELRRGPRQ